MDNRSISATSLAETRPDQRKGIGRTLPSGACDAHVHVYGPFEEFPLPAAAPFQPPLAPVRALGSLWRRFGIERGVFVQGGAYGQDHRALLDAISRAPRNRRGVALVRPGTSDAMLEQLQANGVRGARMNFVRHLGHGFDEVECWEVVRRIEPLGWHLELHVDAPDLERLQKFVQRSPVQIVIDHMGRVDAAFGLDQAPFQALLDLVSYSHCWVKLSGGDRVAKRNALKNTIPFAHALIEAAPERVVWGTDWPHVNCDQPQSDETLFKLLAEITPDDASRAQLLVVNPAHLYGF